MRRHPTKAEAAFKAILDTHRIWHKHQAQFFTAGKLFIVDFRLATCWQKVFVEIDGSSHRGREGYDAKRTEWLAYYRHGTMVRFTNDDVLKRPETIERWLLTHDPPLKRV